MNLFSEIATSWNNWRYCYPDWPPADRTGPCPSIYNTFSCLSGGLMTPMALMEWMSFFSPYSCYHLYCIFLIKLVHHYIWQPLFHLNWNASKSKIYTMLIFYLHISVWHFRCGSNDVSVQWYTQSHRARKLVIYYLETFGTHRCWVMPCISELGLQWIG